LERQSPDSELGKLCSEYYDPITKQKRTDKKVAVKDILVERLKLLMPKDQLTTQIQRMAAEFGMRKWGIPVLILFLPSRTPSWNPVELIIAEAKGWFKRHGP
jgi:hypothetical protein